MPKNLDENFHVSGIHANQTLLALVADTIGRDVKVITRDGICYEGIFAACSPEFEIGLLHAYEIRPDESKNLLPHENDIIEKLHFDHEDIVTVSVTVEEKRGKGFTMDRDYIERSIDVAVDPNEELEVWESDGDVGFDVGEQLTAGKASAGWSVDDMFQANDALGVKSTFEDNLSQYTTAKVEGDNEARVKAEKIAQEIEKNPASRSRALMENDDEERDLDKETPEFQIATHRRSGPGGRAGLGSGQRGGNAGGGQRAAPASARRSDGTPGTGRGRGGGGTYGSGQSSRSFTNSLLSHGRGSLPSGGRFQPGIQRTTAQDVQMEFDQWARRETSEAASGSVRRRASDQNVANLSARNYQSGQRGGPPHHESSVLNRSADEARVSHHPAMSHPHGGSSNTIPRTHGSSSHFSTSRGGHAERIKNLREFQQTFSSTYQCSSAPPINVEEQPPVVSSSSAAVVPKPASSAWNKGPPPNIRAAQVQSAPSQAAAKQGQVGPSNTSQGKSQNLTHQTAQAPAKEKKAPVTTAVVSRASSSASTDTTSTITESQKSTGEAAVPSASSRASQKGVVAAASSAAGRESQKAQIPAAASSSSITPTDPAPSTAIAGESSATSTSAAKKFEFNPDAPAFTPRSSASTRTVTPSTSGQIQPLMSAQTTMPVQGIAIATNPALPLAQTVQASNMMAHGGPQQLYPYNHANMYQVPIYYNPQSLLQNGAQLPPTAGPPTAGAAVAGSSVVANNPGGRVAQVNNMSSLGRRQQQQPGGQNAGVYMAAQPYQQPIISAHYQMPYIATAAAYSMPTGAAGIAPTNVPPPPTGTIVGSGIPPGSMQVIQQQSQNQQPANYSRHIYQNFMVARFPSGSIDCNVGAQVPMMQSAAASSVASSTGNSSNGHNSQPATPLPVSSPGQMQQYPTTGTPQTSYPVIVQMAHGAAPAHAQHMYVQAPQFPLVQGGQQGSYMLYSHGNQFMQLHQPAFGPSQQYPAPPHATIEYAALGDPSLMPPNQGMQLQGPMAHQGAYFAADQYGFFPAHTPGLYQGQIPAGVIVRPGAGNVAQPHNAPPNYQGVPTTGAPNVSSA